MTTPDPVLAEELAVIARIRVGLDWRTPDGHFMGDISVERNDLHTLLSVLDQLLKERDEARGLLSECEMVLTPFGELSDMISVTGAKKVGGPDLAKLFADVPALLARFKERTP